MWSRPRRRVLNEGSRGDYLVHLFAIDYEYDYDLSEQAVEVVRFEVGTDQQGIRDDK